uniref:Putative PD-(D/E)XK nuclease superfamily protein n=1 Tax=viral metagenome TaxID=1070528 RepID=A0A6H2A3C1_9ZZZZ
MPTIQYRNKEGKRLRGATTHMGQNVGWGKDGLVYWSNQQGLEGKTLSEARDTATVSGTIAHYLIECDLKNQTPDLSQYKQEDIDKGETAFIEYLTWRENFHFTPIAIEPNLVSEIWQYGGTPDIIGFVQERLSVIDWKTGRIFANTFGQLVSYKVLWEENHPDKPIEGGYHVLRIPRYEEIPSFHHSHWQRLPDEAWATFECALRLSKYEQVLKKLL